MERRFVDISFLNENNFLLILTGATATGKTEHILKLSELIDIEVISADSRQIYKYLDIGTAKPSKKELEICKHHFVDYLFPDEDYSAGRFAKEADLIITEIRNRNKLPIVVGGSGLYISALVYGLINDYKPNAEIRKKLIERLTNEGIDKLYDELKKIDPESAEKYSDKNPRRVLRALEFFYCNNYPFSKAHNDFKIKSNYKPIFFGIWKEREDLYNTINKRTLKMWELGLVDEVKKILEMGYSPSLNSLNTVGYKETIKFLNSELNEEQTISEIQKNTRRYAKRQLTWFKKYKDLIWLKDNMEKNLKSIINFLKYIKV